MLVRGLPPESAFHRSFSGGATWGWLEESAVTTVELLVGLIRIQLMAHGAKKYQVPKPLRIERPWEATVREAERARRAHTPRREASVDETVSMLSRLFAPPIR